MTTGTPQQGDQYLCHVCLCSRNKESMYIYDCGMVDDILNFTQVQYRKDEQRDVIYPSDKVQE